MTQDLGFANPYRPGAGHMPPHLAGRHQEYREFEQLLDQQVILENMVLTGLRGVGKTVLLETFKPRAMAKGWLWVGTDMSESACVSEETIALRLMADLAVMTANIIIETNLPQTFGFSVPTKSGAQTQTLSYEVLASIYDSVPGLISDKLKAVLEFTWEHLQRQDRTRIIFAYDEAQTLSDNATKEEYPLSVLLDVFQSVQKKGLPFMLILTGLPTLFPKLVDARTYAERMFRVVTVTRLTEKESREAITKPIRTAKCPIKLSGASVEVICRESGGYPYFIQFICREVFDTFIIQQREQGAPSAVPVEPIQRKLDSDFFAGRWARVSDRQRDLLWVIASLDHPDDEFTIQEVVARAKDVPVKNFSLSHTNQILVRLAEQGLVYKNRRGKYAFAVPLLGPFILRNYAPAEH